LSSWRPDKQKGDPTPLQFADHSKQRANFTLGQRTGGLVHDDEPGILTQRLGNRNQLFVGHRHLVDPSVEGQVHLKLTDGILSHPTHMSPVDKLPPGRQLLVEGNVLGDGQVGKKRESW
jgi:hypothetical protein